MEVKPRRVIQVNPPSIQFDEGYKAFPSTPLAGRAFLAPIVGKNPKPHAHYILSNCKYSPDHWGKKSIHCKYSLKPLPFQRRLASSEERLAMTPYKLGCINRLNIAKHLVSPKLLSNCKF